jgi:hypothetical protein
MNPEEARFLKRRMRTDLGDACTGATIDVNPQRDGLQVVVADLAPRPGVRHPALPGMSSSA